MANRLLTQEELDFDVRKLLRELLSELPTDMFIEGQYNWERPEFDEHG